MNTVFESLPLMSPQKWIDLTVGLIGLGTFWTLGSVLKKSFTKFNTPNGHTALFISLAANIVKTLCIAIGILFLIGAVGINIGAIIKGIAVLGLGASLIFKDLLSDVAAGFFIVGYKRFSIGIELTVPLDKAVYTGKIKTMDLRYITLENETQTILIPNSFLFRQPVSISKLVNTKPIE
jgi:small-conductance mechanosensitive channel